MPNRPLPPHSMTIPKSNTWFMATSARRLWLVLALLVALALTACSSDTVPAPAPADESGQEAETAATPTESSEEDAAAPALDDYQAQREACTLESPCWPHVLADAPVPDSFQEAPMLAELVEAGELPPVAERLPSEPLVVEPAESIGTYGGIWQRAFTGPGDRQNIERILYNNLIRWNTGMTELIPYIFRDWESNDDGSQWTFYLREGMKWSDGEPFTTADFMFWYEHMVQSDQIVTAIPSYMTWGGDLAQFEALDETTLQITFAAPFPLFAVQVAGGYDVGSQWIHGATGLGMVAPAHYLEQFHPDFVGEDEANQLAEDAGFESWNLYFLNQNNPHVNADLPVTSPWRPVTQISSDQYQLERNPYFFAVDTEGNQLPYFDGISLELVEELEVLNLRAIAGSYTIQGRHIDFSKLPVLRENQADGDYFINFWTSATRHPITLYFNMDYAGDEALKELIRNVEFRRALSLAVEREEFNEIYFLGVGRPASYCPSGASPYFNSDRWDEEWGRFDPEEANRLLDELGLDQRGSDGFRLMPNGEPLILMMDAISGAFLDYPSIAEMVGQQWADVGVRLQVNPVERSFWVERMEANQHMLSVFEVISWHPETESVFIRGVREFPVGSEWASQTERDPADYDGPDWYKQVVELQWQARAEPNAERRQEIYMEATAIFCDNQPNLGVVVGVPVWTTVIKNYVRNVPKPVEWTTFGQTPGSSFPETWYLVQE